ncbi:uncharacterized protein LOC134787070 [Penaeus indicus]|uniref:uncharacterized protein LOC134787070 n=1 Tax=Penaeus indicus TaxID=29960 RepID=UPI00300C38BE
MVNETSAATKNIYSVSGEQDQLFGATKGRSHAPSVFGELFGRKEMKRKRIRKMNRNRNRNRKRIRKRKRKKKRKRIRKRKRISNRRGHVAHQSNCKQDLSASQFHGKGCSTVLLWQTRGVKCGCWRKLPAIYVSPLLRSFGDELPFLLFLPLILEQIIA